MQQSADSVKKVPLETSGNAPFVAFLEADIKMPVKEAIAPNCRPDLRVRQSDSGAGLRL
jgi:hypothetical protein